MKKKLSARILAVVLAVVCACGLFGCGRNSNVEPTPQPGGWQAGEYTLTSAYERAVELGYAGTLEDFLASIKGKDGADGTNGTDGINGKDGVGIRSVELNAAGELVIRDTNGKVLLKEKLPLCKHSYGNSTIGLAPGCTYAGYNYTVCTKCGDKEYEVLAPTGHSWDNGTEVFAPDCTKNGLQYYTCLTCGETKVEILYVTGVHTFENGACVYCKVSRAQVLDEIYNGNYGYTYFQSLPNGTKLCALYDAVHERVMQFHNDASENAMASGNNYELCEINYAAYGLTDDEAVSVWKTYMDDKPLYYWLGKTLTVNGGNMVLGVDADYAQGATRAAYNETLYATLDEYATIAAGENAYSVALAYHDTIISGIDYAYKNGNVPQDAAWAHNIVGVFEGKGAVCEGYARAYQLLLNMRGIENVFVTGQSRRQSHAWNLVRLDNGKWYWYDLTWDDTPSSYWGTAYNYFCATDEGFLAAHTVDSSDASGIDFLYELPARATADYDGDCIMRLDEFSYEDATYVVVGYNTVSVSEITSKGAFVIPESVPYRGRDFSVVSIMRYKNGEPSVQNVLGYTAQVTSVCIPSTVLYIDDGTLGNKNLENIFVAQDNPRFCDKDGVLYSKTLFTLIQYPAGNKRTAYAIADETYYIAKEALCDSACLQSLHIGKNVNVVGLANWGAGYPDSVRGGSVIVGEWYYILHCLSGACGLTVDEENPNYTVKDGMLFSYFQTVLYAAVPNIETAMIPETVHKVEHYAFKECKMLKNVTFQSDDMVLNGSAFYDCINLEEVVLPTTLNSIGSHAFGNCRSLKRIELPESLTSIGMYAFRDALRLQASVFPQA